MAQGHGEGLPVKSSMEPLLSSTHLTMALSSQKDKNLNSRTPGSPEEGSSSLAWPPAAGTASRGHAQAMSLHKLMAASPYQPHIHSLQASLLCPQGSQSFQQKPSAQATLTAHNALLLAPDTYSCLPVLEAATRMTQLLSWGQAAYRSELIKPPGLQSSPP